MDDDTMDGHDALDDIPLGFSASILEGNVSRNADDSCSSRFSSDTSFIQQLKQLIPVPQFLRQYSRTEPRHDFQDKGDEASHHSLLNENKEDTAFHSGITLSNRYSKSETQNSLSPKSAINRQLENISRPRDSDQDSSGSKIASKRTQKMDSMESHYLPTDERRIKYITGEIATVKSPMERNVTRTGQKLVSQPCPVDEICEFSLNDTKSSWRNASSSDSQMKQMEVPQLQSREAKEISEWAITINNGQICIEGYVRGENNKPTLLRTSSVTDVSDHGKTVVTFGGSCYKLLGNMLVKASVESGVPINVANKFLKGFPSGWKAYCKWGANLNGSDSGSYQGENYSTGSNFIHRLTSSESSSSASHSCSKLQESKDKDCNAMSSNITSPDTSPTMVSATTSDKKITSASGREGKYAAALPPVPELPKIPEDKEPSLSAITPQSFPRKIKSATSNKTRRKTTSNSPKDKRKTKSCSKVVPLARDKKETAKIYKTPQKQTRVKSTKESKTPAIVQIPTCATPRTKSGREVKPVTTYARLALEYQKSARKRSSHYGENAEISLITPVPQSMDAATVFCASLMKPPKKDRTGDRKKSSARKRKSAKILYTPNSKADSSSEPKQLKSPVETTSTNEGGNDGKNSSKIAINETEVEKQESTPRKTKTTTPRKRKEKMKKSKGAQQKPSDVRESAAPDREKIDNSEVAITRLQKRTYTVPISPLESKEITSRFLVLQLEKCDRIEKPKKANVEVNSVPVIGAKKKGRKRAREGGDIARPRKRSRKTNKASVTDPPKIDGNPGAENVFVSPQKDSLPKKEWTKYQKAKLKKLVINCESTNWKEISETMGFPPQECENVYADIFRGKRKTVQKKIQESGPVAITARQGTLKHRQQVRQNLETMKRPKFQDMFASDGAFQSPVDNMFSADLFSVQSASHDFMPVTPNTRPPVGLDETVATPAWFKTPTSGNMFHGSGWTPIATAETPAALKNVFSPQAQVGDENEKRKGADRVILQMQKKMMRGTLREYTNGKVVDSQENIASNRNKKRKNGIDFGCVKDAGTIQNDEEESDMDEYFNASED